MKKENYKFLLWVYFFYCLFTILEYLFRGTWRGLSRTMLFAMPFTITYVLMILWQNKRKKEDE